jgi:hypothetical protein
MPAIILRARNVGNFDFRERPYYVCLQRPHVACEGCR